MTIHPQLALHAQSIEDREEFWLRAAKNIHWHQPPTKAYGVSSRSSPYAGGKEGTWFPNATLNTCFNCLDRHVYPPAHAGSPPLTPSPVTPHLAIDTNYANRTAFHHVSPLPFQLKQYTRITYGEALEMVQTLSGVLKHRGIRKGDVVSTTSMGMTLILTSFQRFSR
jgi:propionyl-CoA synthetase